MGLMELWWGMEFFVGGVEAPNLQRPALCHPPDLGWSLQISPFGFGWPVWSLEFWSSGVKKGRLGNWKHWKQKQTREEALILGEHALNHTKLGRWPGK